MKITFLGAAKLVTGSNYLIETKNSKFLMVAGRSLSSDREANSGLRVEAPCMAMGQVAGAMGALSAQSGVELEDLPLKDIHALLKKHGAVIPGDL